MSSTAIERSLPHNVDAEKSVLGSILVNNEHYYRIVEMLRAEDFYLDAHRVIFRHMMELMEKFLSKKILTPIGGSTIGMPSGGRKFSSSRMVSE